MFFENRNYEVLTPSGWQDFKGIMETQNKELFRITLDDGTLVEATANHCFFNENIKIQVSDLVVGGFIDTINGPAQIMSIQPIGSETVYDLIEVADENHLFIVNESVITKNCDEFSYVRPTIAREFWVSISPTLSTGGKAIITSTPSSDEDQFATIWKQANKCYDEYGNITDLGVNGFKAYEATWEQHPDRDQAWADIEQSRIGEERFRREHCCKFLIDEETLINSLTLSTMESREPSYKQGQIRWFGNPKKDCVYIVALDPSLGTGGDMAAIQVFESPSMQQVAEWQHNRTPIQKQVQVLKEICRTLNETVEATNIYYSVENNTLGEAALVSISEMGEENIPGLFLSEPAKMGTARRHRKGFTTTAKSKLAACAKLKSLVESGKIHIHSKNLISELKTFVSNGASFAAKQGETDDLVLATLLVVRMVQHLKQFHADLDQQVTDRDEFIEPMPFVAVIM